MATELLSSSRAIRDQIGDHLITPKNSAMVVIDYQPSQLAGVGSADRDLLLKNVVSTVKVAAVRRSNRALDGQCRDGPRQADASAARGATQGQPAPRPER